MEENESNKALVNNSFGEDDEELILVGGELYHYLKSCQDEKLLSDVFQDKNRIKEVPDKPHTVVSLAPNEVIALTNKILHSHLLLEEDANDLYKISSELTAQKRSFMNSRKWACGVLTFDLICVYMGVKYNRIRRWTLPIITGSTVLFASMLKRILNSSSFNKKMDEFLGILQNTFHIVRKITQIITEEDSTLYTKQRLSTLNRNSEELSQKNNFTRKLAEITVLTSYTANALKFLIKVCQTVSITLINCPKKYIYRDCENCLALLSNEELGLTAHFTGDTYDLASIHKLKNVYVLMQSECLRLLGFYFCKCSVLSEISDIFEIIVSFTSKVAIVSNNLMRQYRIYCFPQLKPPCKPDKNAKIDESLHLVHNVSKWLNSLLIDSRQLEEYLETESDSSYECIANRITSDFNSIIKELNLLVQYATKSKNYFERECSKVNNTSVNYKSNKNPEDIEISNVTNVAVGFSDFSISGVDEVFLGCSDCSQDFGNSDSGYFHDCKPPENLISELKSALVKKREEFEQRELQALKTSDEIEIYKSCMVDFLPQHNIEEEETCSTSIDSIKNIYPADQINSVNAEASGNSQKDIALAASHISAAWFKMKNIEYFEDDIVE